MESGDCGFVVCRKEGVVRGKKRLESRKEHGLKGGFFGSRARGGCDVVEGWVGGRRPGTGNIKGKGGSVLVGFWFLGGGG